MAKKFLFDDDTKPLNDGPSYMDGFRFGFGMFVAWMVGLLIVSGIGALLARFVHIRY
ncbi:MAG TPA: hypothetical protein VLF41_03645 [Candidatus Nanoarchaeia archaeon]|nr:hypothetical protein [Candidatus Nanoarchaeia archaeon]